MEKGKNLQVVIIAVLAVAILFMSIGFAAYSQTLNINGEVKVEPAKWSIHFDTASFSETAKSVTPTATPTLTNTDISFKVTLNKPGDFYEFTVNAVNDGTFDANLTSITLSSLTEAQDKYLEYIVTYDGEEYETTTTGLALKLAAMSGSTPTAVPVKVRVAYILPENETDLPTTEQTVNVTCSLGYEQIVA